MKIRKKYLGTKVHEMFRKYYSNPVLACYDDLDPDLNASIADSDSSSAGDANSDPGAGSGGPNSDPDPQKMFDQTAVNRYLADDRRKTEAKYKKQLTAALKKQETEYNKLLENKNLTEQDRDSLRVSLAEVEEQLHTKEERLLKEKKELEAKLTGQITETEEKAKTWETRYKDSSIKRELQEAAVKHEAFNTHQMVSALKPYTKLVETDDEFEVMVDLDDVIDGKSVVTTLSPDDAMKRMKELDMYQNLFKANVVSGVGGNSNTDGASGAKLDPRNMTQEQYQEYRKTLGLGLEV